jgi:hypothetical protein
MSLHNSTLTCESERILGVPAYNWRPRASRVKQVQLVRAAKDAAARQAAQAQTDALAAQARANAAATSAFADTQNAARSTPVATNKHYSGNAAEIAVQVAMDEGSRLIVVIRASATSGKYLPCANYRITSPKPMYRLVALALHAARPCVGRRPARARSVA